MGFFFFFLNCSRDQAQREKIFYVLSDKDSRIVCLFDLCCSRNIHRFSCNWVQINVSQQQVVCVILFFYWRKLFDKYDLIKQTNTEQRSSVCMNFVNMFWSSILPWVSPVMIHYVKSFLVGNILLKYATIKNKTKKSNKRTWARSDVIKANKEILREARFLHWKSQTFGLLS